jgi:hypothetical protein
VEVEGVVEEGIGCWDGEEGLEVDDIVVSWREEVVVVPLVAVELDE